MRPNNWTEQDVANNRQPPRVGSVMTIQQMSCYGTVLETFWFNECNFERSSRGFALSA